jgi:acyl-CoA thioester hydrolase
MNASLPADLPHAELAVRPEWIDYNGHMNVGYYLVAFDQVTDVLFETLGLGPAYRAATGHTTYVVETHLTYDREVKAGDRLRVTSQVIDADEKRLHLFHRMEHAQEGHLVSTNELMFLHVDGSGPRAAPWREPARSRLFQLRDAHAELPRPAQLGRVIGIPRR